ncbi:M56 family metallopeptidase [Streptomyces sp. CHA1]|uniref:M56 family metallopeptidase n=1 Tax=unclassified Streptomyces TaxID=2593676 RepID=UPI001BFC5040|nr:MULTISPECIES: M56 family metallopeptidase [unclassified Streptomyces]MBT3156778.1 M56 family metallopeptidase [Streptomyces sp. G11C]MCO6699176.1 M56 family metallopeptidase [Streptomyces sp. CHB9.2]MCO6705468.1 M56 family metallopeptidase [Streptomyces sp. CHA3]MCO6711234.1 M56 family metallopeptidase [Streptomyces sp. CHB19.2]MCO6717411.1 M56 family metallopeptidase [Streptomyces sp. Vc714c-19]
MMLPVALLLLGALTAALAPRLLARAYWREREPVVALWVWQCVVAGVLLCCFLAMALTGAAAWHLVRGHVFAPAPHAVVEAYALGAYGPWAPATAVVLALGGVWTVAMLVREIARARSRRRQRRADLLVRSPLLPGEERDQERLVVLEGDRPDAWWLPGPSPQLVITTAALRRLKGRQLDAIAAHEQGHATMRHDWLRHISAALAHGFPQVAFFGAFRDEMHRLVELAADDMASRRFGRLTTALALVELNEDRGVFGPSPAPEAHLPQRVHRLLAPQARLAPMHRLRLTAAAAVVPVVPLVVTFGPGLLALN